MSAFAMRAVGRGWSLVLSIVVAVAVIAVALVVWATTGDTTSPSGPSRADRQGAVTDAGVNPWAANDPALLPLLDR